MDNAYVHHTNRLLYLLFVLFTLSLTGCGGEQNNDNTTNSVIDQVVDDIYDENEADIQQFARDFVDDVLEETGEEEDFSAELVICPFPTSLQGATPVVFNSYTPNQSNPVNEFNNDFSFQFSQNDYLYVYAPIEFSLIAGEASGNDAIIRVANFGSVTLENYYQGATPRAIVINNVVFEPGFFFDLLEGKITSNLMTTPAGLEEAFYITNGIGPKARAILPLPEMLTCEINNNNFLSGSLVSEANYDINLAEPISSGVLSSAKIFQYRSDATSIAAEDVTLFAVMAAHTNLPPITPPDIQGLNQTHQSSTTSQHLVVASSPVAAGTGVELILDPKGNNAVFQIFTLPNRYSVVDALPAQTLSSSITARTFVTASTRSSVHLGVGFTNILLNFNDQQDLVDRNWVLTPGSQTLAFKASIDDRFSFTPRSGGLIAENVQLILSLQQQVP